MQIKVNGCRIFLAVYNFLILKEMLNKPITFPKVLKFILSEKRKNIEIVLFKYIGVPFLQLSDFVFADGTIY